MPTVADRLIETTRKLPESLAVEVLDFAEFLVSRHVSAKATTQGDRPLSSLCSGLEASHTFSADPVTIQRNLRDEWA